MVNYLLWFKTISFIIRLIFSIISIKPLRDYLNVNNNKKWLNNLIKDKDEIFRLLQQDEDIPEIISMQEEFRQKLE